MGIPKNDLTGKIFGQLTVIKYCNESKWECKCECGKILMVKTSSLTTGKTKSCGCLRGKNCIGNTRSSSPKNDLTGKTFGKLTALYYIKGGFWHCKCECGKETDVDTRNLNSGHTKSCGCLTKTNGHNRIIDMTNFETDTLKVLKYAGSNKQGIARWETVCKVCGRTFFPKGTHLREGVIKSCGCVHSWNERHITQILNDNKISFECQYMFPDLVGQDGIHPLRFDFAIFKDGKLSHLIEYNGKQHYEKMVGSWGENFETQQINDLKKVKYCEEHGIELRIIRYDQEYSLEDLI